LLMAIPTIVQAGVHVQQNDPGITIGSVTVTGIGITFADHSLQTTASTGSVVAGSQYSVPYYAAAGTSTTLSPSPVIQATSSGVTFLSGVNVNGGAAGQIVLTAGTTTNISAGAGNVSIWADSTTNTIFFNPGNTSTGTIVGSTATPTYGDVPLWNSQGYISDSGFPPLYATPGLQNTTFYAQIIEANQLYVQNSLGNGVFFGSGTYVNNDSIYFTYSPISKTMMVSQAIFQNARNLTGIVVQSTVSTSLPFIQIKGINSINQEYWDTSIGGAGGRYRVGTASDSYAIDGYNPANTGYEGILGVYREGDPLSYFGSRELLLKSSTTLCFSNYVGSLVTCLKGNDNATTNTMYSFPATNTIGFMYNDGSSTMSWVNFSTGTTSTITGSSLTVNGITTTPYVAGISMGTSGPNVSPGLYVSTNGWTGANEFVALGSTVTSTVSTGAGTGPTLSITGANAFGLITLITGSVPATNSVILTWTPSLAAPNKFVCVISDGNLNSDVLTGTSNVYVTSSQTTVSLNSGSVALSAATTYNWYYNCGGI
jgi:hypothetical protein